VAATEERVVTVELNGSRAQVTNRGGQLISFRLREHRNAEGEPLDLVRRRSAPPYPFALVDEELAPLPLDDALFAVEEGAGSDGLPQVQLTYRGPLGAASKRFRFLAPDLLEVEIEVADGQPWGVLLGPGVRNAHGVELKGQYRFEGAVYQQGDDLEVVKSSKRSAVSSVEPAGLRWFGLEDNYFLLALVPASPLRSLVLEPVAVGPNGDDGPAPLRPFRDEKELSASEQEWARALQLVAFARGPRFAATAYLGAKKYERLAALPWRLEKTVGWGMFGFLSRPLLAGLLWIHDHLVTNYGWAIVLMTVLLKILLFPLTHKSYVSMLKMQAISPRMQAIRQKYKGKMRDKQGRFNLEAQRKMQEEMNELTRSEGVNPLGGCLPMLLQIPVFFAFFRLLPTAVELRQAPWILWIHDLSVPDPYYLLPIVMGATQVAQQTLTPSSADPMQRRMMQLFPWVFTIISVSFPAGLVLYWTVNNLLTMAQMASYNRWRKRREPGKGGGGRPRRKQARDEAARG